MRYQIVEVSRDRSLSKFIAESLKQLQADALWLEERRAACAESPWFEQFESSFQEQQRELAMLYLDRLEERRSRHRVRAVEQAEPHVEREAAIDRITEVIRRGLNQFAAGVLSARTVGRDALAMPIADRN